MNKFIFSLILFAATIMACNEKLPDHDNSIVPAGTENKTSVAIPGVAIDSTAMAQQRVVLNSPTSAGAVASSVISNPTTTAVGKNPPHGQPGHRCDIEVGAPLNSPATKPATQTITQSATPTVTTTTATPASNVKTAAGMNPPHGQPGHRCDIAVGAPLNSKPTKPATQTVTTTTTPVTQPTQTVTPTNTITNEKTPVTIEPVKAPETTETKKDK